MEDALDPGWVRGLGAKEWYDFLHDRYFVWKYTDHRWLQRNWGYLEAQAAGNAGLVRLLAIRGRIFQAHGAVEIAIGNLSRLGEQAPRAGAYRAAVRAALETVREIGGLGVAGASGLLAVSFPHAYGTIDQFVALALQEVARAHLPISSLPERAEVQRLNAVDLSISQGVVLINIMRRQAWALNQRLGVDTWTPRKVDKVLWASRQSNCGGKFSAGNSSLEEFFAGTD